MLLPLPLARPPRGASSGLDRRRAVLAWSVLLGLLVPAYFLWIADTSHLGWDFRAYYAAATAARAGESFVGISPGIPGVSYVYPPISVALFVPQTVVGDWRLAFVVQTIFNVAAALAVAALVVHTVETREGRLPAPDRLCIAGVCVGSAPAAAVLGLGQVDLVVALGLACAFVALERDRENVAGVALAGAALVKVFPAALGLWLAWRRAWRGLAAAVLTGTTGLALGALWFGLDAYRRYATVLAGRSRIGEFAGTVSPDYIAMSLHRPLSQFLPGVDPHLYAPVSLALLAPVAVLVARRGRTLADRLATYLVAIVAILLVSPASNTLYVVYTYFPVLCLLYLDAARRGRALLLVGTAAIACPIQPAQVAAVLAIAGVPASISAPVLAALRSALTVASVPLLGLLAIVAWCAFHATRRRPATADSHPARAD